MYHMAVESKWTDKSDLSKGSTANLNPISRRPLQSYAVALSPGYSPVYSRILLPYILPSLCNSILFRWW